MTDINPGDTVDVAIRGVQFAYDHNNQHNPGRSSILADDGRRYTMPPQAAITRPGQTDAPDAAALQERINSALKSIDHMADEQTLDPWIAYGLRKRLDPNPRHWPPQVGDVWDDGMPFGGSLWFAQVVHGDSRSNLVMVSEERHDHSRRNQIAPEDLLASAAEVRLAYRRKTGDNA